MNLHYWPIKTPKVPEKLRGPNSEFTRFVLVAHARSGSTMLLSLLKNHPEVLGFGELFRDKRIGFNVEGYDNNDINLMDYRDQKPIRFLDKLIFSPTLDQYRAVGFKLFPVHLKKARLDQVWKWLDKNKDVKIIHLYRRNMLESFCSKRIATLDKQWHIGNTIERSELTPRLEIRPKVLQKFFETTEADFKKTEEYTSHLSTMKLSYEQLLENIELQVNRIETFLGIKGISLAPMTQKKEIRPMSEVIINYDELAHHFKHTTWNSFF